MTPQKRSDSKMLLTIKGRKSSSGGLYWLIPVVVLLLVFLVTLYGKKYRKLNENPNIAFKTTKNEIDLILKPLQLTALHFESLSSSFFIPKESLLRHFKLLSQIGKYESLSIIDADSKLIVSTGKTSDIERFRSTIGKLSKTKPSISPITKGGNLMAFQIAIPIIHQSGKTKWIHTIVKAKHLKKHLPSGVSYIWSKKVLKHSIHKYAPTISLEMK
jgi:hypothetical protein